MTSDKIAELQAKLAEVEADREAAYALYHQAWTDRDAYREELSRLRAIVVSGVEMDDARMDYVVVQVDRETWEQCKAAKEGKA